MINRAIDTPTIHVDGVIFCSNYSGTVRMSLIEAIAEPLEQPDPGFANRYVGTLTMSAESFKQTLAYLNSLSEIWKADGRLSSSD